MALFGRKNRNIGGQLKSKAGDVSGKKVLKKSKTNKRGGINLSTTLTNRDVCEYFMSVGIDHKGDFQSYMYAKGSTKSIELKIDAVALAAACAGAPVPETPVFAEVGGSFSVKNTRNNLIAAFVGPQSLTVGSRRLQTTTCGQVVFLAMTGYKWESGIAFSAEVGVKAEVPELPSFGTGGGGYGGDKEKPTEVESGTYAELASFSINVEAKASVQAKAGISGERLYLSDTVPTYIKKGGAGSTTDVIEKNLMSVLEHGSKKAYIKEDVKKFLNDHGRKQKKNLFKILITGGNVSTSKLVNALEGLQKSTNDDAVKQMSQHHIRALTDFKSQNVLGPYNFVSLWGMKPEAEAGVSAVAEASVKAGAGGIVGAGAEVGVELKGPGIATSLKFTRFRFQIASLAEGMSLGHNARPNLFSTDSSLIGRNVGSGIHARHRKLVDSMKFNRNSPSNSYVIMTQDTNTTYGQMDLTAFELSGKVAVGAEQHLFSGGKLQTGVDGEKEFGGKVKGAKLKVVGVGGTAKIGLKETRLEGHGSVGLKVALNFMRYESAVAFWMPPAEAGRKGNEKTNIQLAQGSGFAFGQSVDVWEFNKHLRNVLAAPKRKCGYMQALAGRLGVTYTQIMEFLMEYGGLIDSLAQLTRMSKSERKKYEAHMPVPSAFLIEATFEAQKLPTVEARWSKKGRWILGPGGLGKTLRGILIPKKIHPGSLQAIRLRYRHADEMSNERTRFSLGIKYIVTLGIQYKSVEEAGSEGIKNLGTTWYNKFKKYNTALAQTKAYEQGVPQVALLHQ